MGRRRDVRITAKLADGPWQRNDFLKSGFAPASECTKVADMDNPAQALEEARRAGIDLSLLDVNLALSYEERVLRHQSALDLVQMLREAGSAHEKSKRAAAAVR